MAEMWLTRDKDNDLFLFIGTEKPKKRENNGSGFVLKL